MEVPQRGINLSSLLQVSKGETEMKQLTTTILDPNYCQERVHVARYPSHQCIRTPIQGSVYCWQHTKVTGRLFYRYEVNKYGITVLSVVKETDHLLWLQFGDRRRKSELVFDTFAKAKNEFVRRMKFRLRNVKRDLVEAETLTQRRVFHSCGLKWKKGKVE